MYPLFKGPSALLTAVFNGCFFFFFFFLQTRGTSCTTYPRKSERRRKNTQSWPLTGKRKSYITSNLLPGNIYFLFKCFKIKTFVKKKRRHFWTGAAHENLKPVMKSSRLSQGVTLAADAFLGGEFSLLVGQGSPHSFVWSTPRAPGGQVAEHARTQTDRNRD